MLLGTTAIKNRGFEASCARLIQVAINCSHACRLADLQAFACLYNKLALSLPHCSLCLKCSEITSLELLTTFHRHLKGALQLSSWQSHALSYALRSCDLMAESRVMCRNSSKKPTLKDWIQVFRASLPQFKLRASLDTSFSSEERQVSPCRSTCTCCQLVRFQATTLCTP